MCLWIADERCVRWLSWLHWNYQHSGELGWGEMWALKQELGNLFKFMKTEAILGHYPSSVVLATPIWGDMCVCVYIYACVCIKNLVRGVCSCLSDLAWFHHIKSVFWIYPGDFYISLRRAVLSVFPSWLAGCDAERHAKDDSRIWKLGRAPSRVKGVCEQGAGAL